MPYDNLIGELNIVMLTLNQYTLTLKMLVEIYGFNS
jgi:hypothetical protein